MSENQKTMIVEGIVKYKRGTPQDIKDEASRHCNTKGIFVGNDSGIKCSRCLNWLRSDDIAKAIDDFLPDILGHARGSFLGYEGEEMTQIAIVFDNQGFGITSRDWNFKTVPRDGDYPDNFDSPIITRKLKASNKKKREKKKKIIEENFIDEDLINNLMELRRQRKKNK